MKSFGSDNHSGIHPLILQAITSANHEHSLAYGDDPITLEAKDRLKALFGADTEALFIMNGTGANVVGLQCLLRQYEAVICTESAHIHVDECGAPERISGCKLLTIPSKDGKLTIDGIQQFLHYKGDQHHVQPRVIAISQTTELGTVYTIDEIRKLTAYAHENEMLVYMDGARLANATASLNVKAASMTVEAGVDVFSFGGTKNGMMLGEVLIFSNRSVTMNAPFIRKQSTQLYSKMRFVSAQYIAYLESDLWLNNAKTANAMAKLLEKELLTIPEITISQPVEANTVFAVIPPALINPLLKHYFFYMWDEAANEARFMCSFDTTEEDVMNFASTIKKLVGSYV